MILCCGEALIDMLPRETAEGEAAFAPHVGGALFNSAVALGRLGVPVSFFSGLSNDLFGAKLQAALRASKVDFSHAVISSRPTTLAFVSLDQGQASYFFYDESSAGRMLFEADLPDPDDAVEALLFGGISLATEPCGSTYEALMTRESASRVIMLDPNIRQAFIRDPLAHKARMRRMMAIADIIKISEEDLAWFGGPASSGEAAQVLLAAGTKLVIVTSGGKGSAAYWRGGSFVISALNVDVVDTVGAGDSFNAGVLAALRKSGSLTKERLGSLTTDVVRDALSFATRVAAVTVSRAGANPPWANEM
ncbi:carbohydrate kinase [Chelativorans sp. AA-79]|uniref:carbohydrate kinase family protein n=1 Tax=Chelativorans sp. AA-79 TaxID=3028735 RepID=UPI0023F94F21|nr:carbohydrate kinase [Chelativorans sp. AA-79]WEX07790.1 carbohydrate kinase [Chelativorans sp. AA-79]